MDRWPITPEQKQQAVDALMRIVESNDTPLIIRACRVLIAMDEANLKAEPDAVTEEQRNRFQALLRRIQKEN